jgi:hypothetical protein
MTVLANGDVNVGTAGTAASPSTIRGQLHHGVLQLGHDGIWNYRQRPPLARVKTFEEGLLGLLRSQQGDLLKAIADSGDLDDADNPDLRPSARHPVVAPEAIPPASRSLPPADASSA